jgi:hypothetical protein
MTPMIFKERDAMDSVEEQLQAREPIFHRPELGTTRADFERMTDLDFWEVGASGQRYSRAFVLDELEKRHAAPHADVWETSDFTCTKLAGDVYLVTYTLVQNQARVSRRATIWKHTPDGWKILYHQGTLVSQALAIVG